MERIKLGTSALDDRRAGIDVPMTKLSIGIPVDQDYIGDQILPVLSQPLSTAKLAKFGNEAFRTRDDRVGDFSQPDKIDVGLDSVSIEVDGHALEAPISDRQAKESMQGPLRVNLEMQAVMTVKSAMSLSREKLQADLVTSTAVYATTHKKDLNGLSQRWDDNSIDPIDNLIDAIETVVPDDSGKRPNVFWMGQQVWAKLILNTKMKDRIFGNHNPQGLITKAAVAGLLGLDKVLVGVAISRADGTEAITKLWGKSAGLLYVAPTSGNRLPSFGYTVEQTVFENSSEQVVRIRDEHMGASGGDWAKRSHFYTPASVFPASGFLFSNAVA